MNIRSLTTRIPENVPTPVTLALIMAALLFGATVVCGVESSHGAQRVEHPDTAYVNAGGADPADGWEACRARAAYHLTEPQVAAFLAAEKGWEQGKAERVTRLSAEHLCPGSVVTVNA